MEQHAVLLSVCQWNSTPTDRSCQHPRLPTWVPGVRYVAWRCAGAGLRLQRGQQPGRTLSVTPWPPVCEGRQILFYEVWHRKQIVCPCIQKHLSGRSEGGEHRPQARKSERICLEMNSLVNLVWAPGCSPLALFDLKLSFPGF